MSIKHPALSPPIATIPDSFGLPSSCALTFCSHAPASPTPHPHPSSISSWNPPMLALAQRGDETPEDVVYNVCTRARCFYMLLAGAIILRVRCVRGSRWSGSVGACKRPDKVPCIAKRSLAIGRLVPAPILAAPLFATCMFCVCMVSWDTSGILKFN